MADDVEDDGVAKTAAKKPKSRSPNHPTMSLGDAIEKVKILHAEYGTQAAAAEDACRVMGYKVNSSSGLQCMATLAAYGLVDSTGRGDDRKLAVSKGAERILREAPDRRELIKAAAVAPAIHQEVLSHFKGELPHTDILRRYLVWERPENSRFTDDAVVPFIERFRATLAFSGATKDDKIVSEDEESESPSVGDYVQWVSQGVEQFKEPMRVVDISADGEWAFLDGSPTGVAMSELTVVERPRQPLDERRGPPVNPHFKPGDGGPGLGSSSANDRLTLDEGVVVLQWPGELSADSVSDLEGWLTVVVNRMKRKAGLDDKK